MRGLTESSTGFILKSASRRSRRCIERVTTSLRIHGEWFSGAVTQRESADIERSPPLGVEQVINKKSIAEATLVAEQLISKIRKCAGDILTQVQSTKNEHRSQDSLPYDFSGTVATQHSGPAQPTFSSKTSYDDVRDWFSAEGGKHALNSSASRFRAWCFYHSANSIDSIASVLPPRRAEGSDEERRKLTKKQKQSEDRAQHRRRAQSCLINSIVCGLPGRPRVVYCALAGKCAGPIDVLAFGSPVHSPQLPSPMSTVCGSM